MAHAAAAYGARLARLGRILTQFVWDVANENGYCDDGVNEWRGRVNGALVNDDLLGSLDPRLIKLRRDRCPDLRNYFDSPLPDGTRCVNS